ncbi:IS3 family transposase [Clostridioides difficile]|uniref:IS3 family transposase n=1 Tax=Clostridioides difficile TaxID=1496 RepID=UPI003A8AD36A
MKDEVDYRMCRTFDEVKNLVSNYIEYYNNKKIMWIKKDDSCTLQESSCGFIITPWFLTV